MSVFIVLGILWAVVLVAPAVRARSRQRAEFSASFRRQMEAIGPPGTATATLTGVRPRPQAVAARRRRGVVAALTAGMAASAVVGAVPGLRGVWAGGLVLFNLLLAYLALLARQHDRAGRERVRSTVLVG